MVAICFLSELTELGEWKLAWPPKIYTWDGNTARTGKAILILRTGWLVLLCNVCIFPFLSL
jgi:hypothetical protein